MTRTASDIVSAEIHYCVSSLVSTLAGNGLAGDLDGPLGELCEQAFELCSPIQDFEEAAIQAGWSMDDNEISRQNPDSDDPTDREFADDWQDACEASGIEPYDREVYEHWIVSDWLADKLAEKGEKVDKDFAGMTVWARTTTGQAISMDHVIETIAAELAARYGAPAVRNDG